MKKTVPLFSVVVLVSVLTACYVVSTDDDRVTIHGTVTITLDGVPYNTDNFPFYSRTSNTGEALSRDVGPPSYCPELSAYTASERWDANRLGHAYADEGRNNADRTNGTFKWTMKILPGKLPCFIYFSVALPYDFTNYVTPHVVSYKMNEGIWVNKESESIDIGIIDYKKLQLSGNLPVTINGEPFDYINASDVQMFVYQFFPNEMRFPANISPNGDWSIDAYVPVSTQPLQFRVAARKNGAVFRQDLNPDDVITVHDTDKEVIFPSNPSIDFKAFSISGTIKFIISDSKNTLSSYGIEFIDENLKEPGYPNYPRHYAWDIEIARIHEFSPQSVNDDLHCWETMIPAFSFPHTLQFECHAGLTGNTGGASITSSSVVINSETDLNSINIGSFYVKRRSVKYGSSTYLQDYLEPVID
jgi:hypothetical protein